MIQLNIARAPSKLALIFGFFDKPDDKRRSINFGIDYPGYPAGIDVVVNELAWEDGSGESWCFEGYITNRAEGSKDLLNGTRVKGCFRTDTRIGWIKTAMA